jgi:hypothetical protein
MTSPQAEAEAAFAAGYAAADERQAFYMSRPGEGVRWPSDDLSWDSPAPAARPKGLHYLEPPEPIPAYWSDEPVLVPQVLTPPVVDVDVPVSLSGSVHGGWRSLVPAGSGAVVVDGRLPAETPSAAPRRRSLFARLLGRGR